MASRSENMRAIRRRNTTPELQIRSLPHQVGLRYRVDYRVGTGRSAPRPDIAFTRAKVAVFIDGCFWHRCPEHSTMPKTNRKFWAAKLQRNVERDRGTNRALDATGWTVIRNWEHVPAHAAADRVMRAVARRGLRT